MIYVKQGDRRPAAPAQMVKGTSIVDLSTATAVQFRMWLPEESVDTVFELASIVDAVNGEVEYRWAVGDTDRPGQYYATWTVTWPDATTETFPTLGYDIVYIDGGSPAL